MENKALQRSLRALGILCLLFPISSLAQLSREIDRLPNEASPEGRVLRIHLEAMTPKSFQVWSTLAPHASPTITRLLFQAINDILRTRKGKEICAILQNNEEFSTLLGLRGDSAQEAVRTCASTPRVPSRRRQRVVSLPRNWFVVLTDENRAVDSWTNSANFSFLILPKRLLNREEIIYRAAHELAVFFDDKHRSDAQWHLNEGRARELKFIAEARSLEPCDVLPKINQLHFSQVTLTARALQWETQVLQELPEKYPLKAVHREWLDSGYECSERVRDLLAVMGKIAPMMSAQDTIHAAMQGRSLCREDLEYIDRPMPLPNVKDLEKIMVSRKDTPPTPLLCYLLEPQLGRENGGLSHGPRPNMSSGTRGAGRSAGKGD